jgi:hypothetical protein
MKARSGRGNQHLLWGVETTQSAFSGLTNTWEKNANHKTAR